MSGKVNIALQVLPMTPPEKVYGVVDRTIEAIQHSGVKYRVCPFETVMEGEYDQLMAVIEKVKDACFATGTEELIMNLKIHVNKNKDMTIEDKTFKYDKLK